MSAVLYSSSDRIGVIALDRHEARNALDRGSEDARQGLLAFAEEHAPLRQGH